VIWIALQVLLLALIRFAFSRLNRITMDHLSAKHFDLGLIPGQNSSQHGGFDEASKSFVGPSIN